jgi:hypothetical protein
MAAKRHRNTFYYLAHGFFSLVSYDKLGQVLGMTTTLDKFLNETFVIRANL